MTLKNLFLIGYLLIIAWGAECPEGFIEVNGDCYYKKHLQAAKSTEFHLFFYH